MNPPINRENLRDVLIALAAAIGLAWVVASFKEGASNIPPLPAPTAATFSRHKKHHEKCHPNPSAANALSLRGYSGVRQA